MGSCVYLLRSPLRGAISPKTAWSLRSTISAAMSDLDIKSFRSSFHGQILEPADPGYDEARQIWNASVSKRPRVIARCSGVADVITAIDFARANNVLTSIRGGGHNVGGRALC